MACKSKTIMVPVQTSESTLESGTGSEVTQTPGDAIRQSSEGKTKTTEPGRKRRRRRKRMRIGDALRHEGLDEREVARKLADVVTRHTPESDEDAEGSTDKLLVDVLKECLRHLDDGPSIADRIPVPVRLIHKVPRPQRSESNENLDKK